MNRKLTFLGPLLVAVLSSGCGGGGGSGGDAGSTPNVTSPPPLVTSSSYSADIVEIDAVRADSGESVPVSDLPLEGIEINVPDE